MNDLLAAATLARFRAYAPYSGFTVGAALRAPSGRIVAGCNVENAAFPLGLCAEANALGALVAAGERRVVEVLVLGEGPPPCTPCGGCRQRLAELAEAATPVHVAAPDGRVLLSTTLGELLPAAFRLDRRPAIGAVTAEEMVRQRAPGFVPRVGLVLGSGLGALAGRLQVVAELDTRDLPGFPAPTVEGHRGRLLLGSLAGVPVACLEGRPHLYEGHPAPAIAMPVRLLRALGCSLVVLASAVGSLRPDLGPGALALVTDHLNLHGTNPLVGPNDERIGPRFPDLVDLYDPGLRARVRGVAGRLGQPLAEGVLAGWLGPCFETPAEIRMLRLLGADLVGMSMVPEAIAGRHCGLRVLGIAVVTNLAAGLSPDPTSHTETLERANEAAGRLGELVEAALPELVR